MSKPFDQLSDEQKKNLLQGSFFELNLQRDVILKFSTSNAVATFANLSPEQSLQFGLQLMNAVNRQHPKLQFTAEPTSLHGGRFGLFAKDHEPKTQPAPTDTNKPKPK